MTAAGKVTTSRLVPGARILVRETLAAGGVVRVLTSANRPDRPGNLVATVAEVRTLAGPGRRRSIVTDLGVLDSTAAASHYPAAAAAVSPPPAASCDPAWHAAGSREPATFIVKVDRSLVDLPPMHHGSRATCTGHLERSIEDLMATYGARRVIVTRLTEASA